MDTQSANTSSILEPARRSESRRRLECRGAAPEVPFIESVPEDLQCQICLGAAVDPVVTEECGHLFCRDCIVVALDRKKECPVDRQKLTYNDLRKDVRTQRKIMGLPTACYNKKAGCSWVGPYSDLEKHAERCDFTTMKCPFAPHGCDAVGTRKTLQDHLSVSLSVHVSLLCSAVTKLTEENLALQQEVELLQREEMRFMWVIPSFESKRGPVYSRKFCAKGLYWYLGIDFDGPDQHAGVYLFAEGHNRRVDFKLVLYNQDQAKDKVHIVNDWSNDYKGKGWGPLKFIDRTNLAGTGFMVNGCVRVGVEIESEPFE